MVHSSSSDAHCLPGKVLEYVLLSVSGARGVVLTLQDEHATGASPRRRGNDGGRSVRLERVVVCGRESAVLCLLVFFLFFSSAALQLWNRPLGAG